MYFKDNGKDRRWVYFGDGYKFNNYQFSKPQQWIAVGQSLQKILDLSTELGDFLDKLETDHGPLKVKKKDKASGHISEHSKPILPLVEKEDVEYYSRKLEQIGTDVSLITSVDSSIIDLRTYKNLMVFMESNGKWKKREKISEHFDYIILIRIKEYMESLYHDVLKKQDDKTNEIVIPEPTIENREFYEHFLRCRDSYCEGDKETALAILRKCVENILARLWVLSHESFNDIDLKKFKGIGLDNLPDWLQNQNILEEQEKRDLRPYVKYGNAGSHVVAEIPLKKIESETVLKLNQGIVSVNNLVSKYQDWMKKRGYCSIDFDKTGLSASVGDLNDYIARNKVDKTLSRQDIDEFKE